MINVWLALPSAVKENAKEMRSRPRVVGDALTSEQARLLGRTSGDVAVLMRKPRLIGVVHHLVSVYLDSIADVAVLVSAGAVVLGAWDADGSRRGEYPLHTDLKRFMPPRYEGAGGSVVEIEDTTLRDISLSWGQGARDFG